MVVDTFWQLGTLVYGGGNIFKFVYGGGYILALVYGVAHSLALFMVMDTF